MKYKLIKWLKRLFAPRYCVHVDVTKEELKKAYQSEEDLYNFLNKKILEAQDKMESGDYERRWLFDKNNSSHRSRTRDNKRA